MPVFQKSIKKLTMVLFVIVCIMVFTACGEGQEISLKKVQPTVTPIPAVQVEIERPTYTVERGTIVRTVDFTGRLSPIQEFPLLFGASGRIGEVNYKVGDMVEEGAIIAALDYAADLQRDKRLNEIALRRAEIAVERAQLYLDDTLERSPNNENEIQLREWELELAQLSYEEVQIRMSEQQETIDAALITAPISGLITELTARVNKNAEEFSAVGSIADVSATTIRVDSYSISIDELTEGMAVSFYLYNNPSDTFTGVIRQLPYPNGTGPARDTDKYVYIDFDDPSLSEGMNLGERFEMTAVVGTATDVLWLPPAAIREFSGRTFVMVQDGDIQRSVDVTLGLTNGKMTEIVAGLEEGQVVIGQ